MAAGYDAAQRRVLRERLLAGALPACPACGERLERQPVVRPPEVAYVRQRVVLVCTGCGRSAAIDVKAGGPP